MISFKLLLAVGLTFQLAEVKNPSFDSQSDMKAAIRTHYCVAEPVKVPEVLDVQTEEVETVQTKMEINSSVVCNATASPKVPKPQFRKKTTYLELPVFSPQVKKCIDGNKLMSIYLKFTRECAINLLRQVEKPTPEIYSQYAQLIGDKYTDIRDTNKTTESFRKHVAKVIRNYRTRVKQHEGKQTATTSESRGAIFQSAVIETRPGLAGVKLTQEHQQELLSIFENSNSKIDKLHVSYLMKETFGTRRKLIETADTCSEILKAYPAFKYFEWIQQEFQELLGASPSRLEREHNFNFLISASAKLTLKQPKSDADIIDLLNFLHKSSARKSDTRKCPIIMKQFCQNVDLLPQETDAPNAIIYVGDNDEIAAAFILGRGLVLHKLDHKTVKCFDVIDALLAYYYVYDLRYPVAYQGLLRVLQIKILKRSLDVTECIPAKLSILLKTI